MRKIGRAAHEGGGGDGSGSGKSKGVDKRKERGWKGRRRLALRARSVPVRRVNYIAPSIRLGFLQSLGFTRDRAKRRNIGEVRTEGEGEREWHETAEQSKARRNTEE